MPMEAGAYFLESPGEPLVQRSLKLESPAPGEAVVEVAACGLCHTDLGFASGAVPTRHELPLVLGHEVVGKVVETGEGADHLAGCEVIVPAVLPCGECAFCRAGRGNACPRQKMPGNDIHGGFATHLKVPAHPLVPLDGRLAEVDRRMLSVVADAVSTAYQAVLRAELEAEDAVFVVGAGGVGGFVVQIAHALGARVVACDVDPGRLELAAAHGAEETVDSSGLSSKELRRQVHGFAKAWGIPSLRYRIFEASGTPEGQLAAYGLLARAATLIQVGYTEKTVEVRLSNLMAFDATIHGTWGCPPEVYPEILDLIADGEVVLEPFVDYAPMSDLNRLLDDMAGHRLRQRMILDPKS
jgi:6-hydroxycyclohex-1-ene-1-carbonyl-CoA dehydrogenase